MFELRQVGKDTYYIDNHNIMGVYRLNEEEVCLIDTGNGAKAAMQIEQILAEKGWKLKFILNTHTHIDHLGGNRVLMEKWKCPAYATRTDNAFAVNKTLEAAYMCGGYPNLEVRTVFDHPGDIGFRDIEDFQLPKGLEYISLPGHTFGMIGFKTSDDVWFIGDSVLNERSLEKYQFGYLYDVQGYLDTLERLEALKGSCFIPSHGKAVADIKPLARANRKNIFSVIETILTCCREPKAFDYLQKDIYENYGIPANMIQHALVGSTLRSYITYLQDDGKLAPVFKENMLYWQAV